MCGAAGAAALLLRAGRATQKVLSLLVLPGFTRTKVQILTSGSQGNGTPAARRQGAQTPAQMTTPMPAAGAAAGGAGGVPTTSTPTNVYKCVLVLLHAAIYASAY